MIKEKLITFAILGITAGTLVTSCQNDNRRDNRPPASEKISPVAAHQFCGNSSCSGSSASPVNYQGQNPQYYQDRNRNEMNDDMYRYDNHGQINTYKRPTMWHHLDEENRMRGDQGFRNNMDYNRQNQQSYYSNQGNYGGEPSRNPQDYEPRMMTPNQMQSKPEHW